jgi:hypothetical protein
MNLKARLKMYLTLTDQNDNKFTVSKDHIVGWQHIEKLNATNLILTIHKPGECVSVKEGPEEILTLLNKGKA